MPAAARAAGAGLLAAGRWRDLLTRSSPFTEGDRRDDPVAEPATDADDDCRRSMRSALESHLIPRLVQAQPTDAAPAGGRPAALRPLDDEVVAFARWCAAGDRAGAAALIDRLRAQGIDEEGLFFDLIAPAARRLGRQWEEDEVSFTDVTIGLVLMHEVIHAMGYEYLDGPQDAGGARRVMLACAPGSQHVLGLSIVAETFRRGGWQVVVEVSPSIRELCHAVRNEWFDLVGLSVSLDGQLQALPDLVARLKAASRNPDTPVLLGGPVFTAHRLAPAAFGALAICVDARDAVVVADVVRRS